MRGRATQRIRMWTMILSLAAIGLVTIDARAADDVPILALDAQGHTAVVNKVLFTPDGKEVITVADDKTIRFWDVVSGQPLRVLRPPIGTGSEGMIYCVAISPDGQTLAVGGFGFRGGDHWIYLISPQKEQVKRVLKGHTNVVHDLEFSRDGSKLISGSGDNTARVWNVSTGETIQVLEGHELDIYGVVFAPEGSRCATSSYDHTARIWSVNTGNQLAMLQGHEAEIRCIDWSPDGTQLATGSKDQTVRTWTPTGRMMKTLDNLGEHSISSIRFTADGRSLLYVHGFGRTKDITGLIDLKTGEQTVQFKGHNNTIMDGRISPDGQLAATVGGNDEETFLWRLEDGQEVHKFVGQGRVPWAAAWSADGTTIAWGHSSSGSSLEANKPLEYTFDLTLLEHGDPVTESTVGNFQRASFERGPLKLESSGKSSVDVKQGGQTVTVLEPVSDYDKAYDRIRCFTLLPGNRAVVGSGFALWIYDTNSGERLRRLDGHSGAIWAMSLSPDGRYLLSASGDMTLRVWDVNAPGDDPIEPLLSLFFADKEWIAWTPQGYYAASPGGERLMGWHKNNGREQLASFFPSSQFHKQFYRPDVIKLLLQTGSVQRALEAAGSSGPIKTVAQNLPPEVEIVSPSEANTQSPSDEITIRVSATQTGSNPITSLQILLDGRPLNGKDGIQNFDGSSRTVTHRFHVPLVPGVQHSIVARADSAVNYALSKEVIVSYQSPSSELRRPSLYVLAIGVADYDDESLKLDFADDDARNLAKTLQERSFDLFHTIDTRLVVDKDATQKGILGGLVWLKQQMTQHDIGVLFYSGHGAKDETGNFYLLPSDVDTNQPLLLSAVSDAQVKGILQGIPGRLMVMLDACHAGVLGGDRRKNSSSLVDDLVRELSNDDYGVVVMASSMGREFSLESPDNKSGMFTLALCEGLAGEADHNDDLQVYFNELDLYVSDRVKELTGGKQHPVTAKPATIRPFPLSTRK